MYFIYSCASWTQVHKYTSTHSILTSKYYLFVYSVQLSIIDSPMIFRSLTPQCVLTELSTHKQRRNNVILFNFINQDRTRCVLMQIQAHTSVCNLIRSLFDRLFVLFTNYILFSSLKTTERSTCSYNCTVLFENVRLTIPVCVWHTLIRAMCLKIKFQCNQTSAT